MFKVACKMVLQNPGKIFLTAAVILVVFSYVNSVA